MTWRNWAGNLVWRPERVHHPRAVEDVVSLVKQARHSGRTVRAVGAGYSYTPLVQTDHDLVALDGLSGMESVDLEAGTATFKAGTTLHQLAKDLRRHGAAMANLGDIDKQTLAGAIATGTHGTGIGIGSLSDRVERLTLVDGTGEVRDLDLARNPDLFPSAQVSLGALGIITSVTLRVEPAYHLRIERGAGEFDAVVADLDRHTRENRNFEFFWFPNDGLVYTKRMNYADPADTRRASRRRRIVRFANDILVENFIVWVACETALRFPGLRSRWLSMARRLVPRDVNVASADTAYATPRLVRHFEVEYAIPAERGADALASLDKTLRQFPVRTLIPIEVRFARGESIPLSMAEGGNVMYIAVHAYHRERYIQFFDVCEKIFIAHGGRPHWGKMHNLGQPELSRRYPRWGEFQKARQSLDPDGVFLNDYLRRLLLPSGHHEPEDASLTYLTADAEIEQ